MHVGRGFALAPVARGTDSGFIEGSVIDEIFTYALDVGVFARGPDVTLSPESVTSIPASRHARPTAAPN